MSRGTCSIYVDAMVITIAPNSLHFLHHQTLNLTADGS